MPLLPSRVARSYLATMPRSACIVAAGTFGDSYCLLKNRDRNYVPKIKLVHEVHDGMEVAYIKDEKTGWIEGLNGNGIGIVNAALMVSRDESERDEVERTGKKLLDGDRILRALTEKTIDAAAKSIRTHKGGLKGHTLISNGKKTFYVEMPDSNDINYGEVPHDELFVRTNHGVEFPDAGYVEGPREESSKSRQAEAEDVLAEVDSADDVATALLKARDDRWDPMEMVRDNRSEKRMRTTTQMVLDLTNKKLVLYLLPGRIKYLGLDDRLPEGFEPEIAVEVREYDDLSEDTDGKSKVVWKKNAFTRADEDIIEVVPMHRKQGIKVTTDVSGLLPIMDPVYNVREVFKQLVLLEDHLFHERKRCLDCIWKHLLTAEALAEEAVTLDVEGSHPDVCTLAEDIREVQRLVQAGEDLREVAQRVRAVRKGLLGTATSMKVAEAGCNIRDMGYAWIDPQGETYALLADVSHDNWAQMHAAEHLTRSTRGPYHEFLENGWIRVTNYSILGVAKKDTPPIAAWQAAVDVVMQSTMRDHSIDPFTDHVHVIEMSGRWVDYTIADFISEYGRPDQERFYFDQKVLRRAAEIPVKSSFDFIPFKPGDLITYGKFQNKPGMVQRLFVQDGIPMIEIAPVGHARQKNKIVSLFRVRHAEPAQRVASSWIDRCAWRNEKPDGARYHQLLQALRAQVSYNKDRGLGNTAELWMAWRVFYAQGQVWAKHVLEHLAHPPGKAKPLEMAVRQFVRDYGLGKGPKDIVAWFEDNERRLDFLASARAWPLRQEVPDGTMRVGPFDVVNAVQAEGKNLEDAVGVLEDVVRLVRQSDVPDMASTLYGTVYLVGQVERKNWAAWYKEGPDAIFLRTHIRGVSTQDVLRHLVHELAHRLWLKRLDREVKAAWTTQHKLMEIHRPNVRLPDVGEVLPFLLNNKRVRYDGHDGSFGHLVPVDGGDIMRVDRMKLMGWMQDADHSAQFPTRYAQTSAEEHFAEAVSLYVLGKLHGDNLRMFKEIVMGKTPMVVRVASRWLRSSFNMPLYFGSSKQVGRLPAFATLSSLPMFARQLAGRSGFLYTVRLKTQNVFRGIDLVRRHGSWPPAREDLSTKGQQLYDDIARGHLHGATIDAEDLDFIFKSPHGLWAALIESSPTVMDDARTQRWLQRNGYGACYIIGAPMSSAQTRLTHVVVFDPSDVEIISEEPASQRTAGDLVQLFPTRTPAPAVRAKHTVTLGGKKYALSADGGPLGDPRDDLANGDIGGAQIVDMPAFRKPEPYRFLWAYDTEDDSVSMWRVTDGDLKVWGPATGFASKIIALDRKGELNRVTSAEMVKLNRAMQKKEAEQLRSIKKWLADNADDYQKFVDKVAWDVFNRDVKPGLEMRLQEAGRGVVPIGFKVQENQLDYRSRGEQLRSHILTEEMAKFTVEKIEAEVRSRGVDPDAPGHDIQAAYWSMNDVVQEVWKKYTRSARLAATGLRSARTWGDVGVRRGRKHAETPQVKDASSQIFQGFPQQQRMAARYKEKKKVKTKDGDEMTVYVYSERQVQHRHREKAERYEGLSKNIDKLRKQVTKDIGSDDPKTRLTALAIGLIDATFERVGNDGSADDGHFGVTGWLKKHVTFGNGKATIRYVGKSGVDHEKVVDDKKLVSALKDCCGDKKPDDALLSFGKDDDEGPVKISARDVNTYLKPFDVTAKDLRGFHANALMMDNLRARRKEGGPLPKDKAEKVKRLKQEFKDALDATAEDVGHEASTLRSQYLVPGLEDAYMKDGTVIDNLKDASAHRVAARWLQATKSEAEREDEEIERLVRSPPKKKPPRSDSRRERVDTSRDEDRDPDLSLNYKDIGG